MKASLAGWVVLATLSATPLAAQTYPSRTITIVSPAPAGGVTDTARRRR
jgi:tripartite-type tricarboxylate transporter receptor subunit TctC